MPQDRKQQENEKSGQELSGQPHNRERLGQIRQQLEYSSEVQRVVLEVLHLSLKDMTLEELSRRTLGLLMSVPELSFEQKGGIFLKEEGREGFTLKAQRGMTETWLGKCVKSGLGRCLCGGQPHTKDIMLVECRDEQCYQSRTGTVRHKHYCIPLFSGEELLGVMNILVGAGHEGSQQERGFLKAIADTLAGVIKRKQDENRLFDDRLVLEKEVKRRSEELLALNENLLLEVQQHQRSRQALLRAQKDLEETLRDLRSTNKKLQEMNQRKTEFISLIAHELRAPLSAIRNAASVLLRKTLASPVSDQMERQMLDIILNNADRQTSTLMDLVDMSRIESGSFVLGKADINMVNVARSVLEQFSLQAEQKGIALHLDRAAEEIKADADENSMRRVLTRLVGNAIKFTSSGGSVTVKIERKADETRVSVTDTGVGIKQEDLGRIFQKFYRGEAQAPAESRGVGLGLSIAKGIIEMHGGALSVSSRPGRGSSFAFGIPVSKESRRKKILIIEDERDIALTLGEVFRQEGFDPITADDGRKGLQKARAEHPDGITLNLKLPELSGEEVCRELRKDPMTECIPIVMLTAKGSETDRVIGRVLGADYYFAKPSDPYEIVDKLKALMGVKRCP